MAVVLLACCALILPCAVQIKDDAGWVRSAASLKAIGEAFHDYHDSYGKLPPAVIRDKDGKPLYSWRVALLPFLEQVDLYRQFKVHERWDSPHNKRLLENTPRCYAPLGGAGAPGMTHYQVFVGPGTAFERDGLTWASFPDGLADTLVVVEAAEPVPWSKPVDLTYAPDRPLPRLGLFTKPVHVLCYQVAKKPGFNACFGDGKARFLSASIEEGTLRALITRNGGEQVDLKKLE